MDGRETRPFSSSSYQTQRGFSGYISGSATQPQGFHSLPVFRSITNPNLHIQPNAMGNSLRSTFPVDPSPSQDNANNTIVTVGNSHHDINNTPTPPSEAARKKRGRPRKYGPDGSVSLALTAVSHGLDSPTPKKGRGRPPGTGRKQQLAAVGQLMSESAGIAFTPHVITVDVGEDVAAKVLSFSQQRPRALCILSGNGIVSAVTLRNPASSGGNISYEGRFEIVCLSGSYLVGDSGGPRSRVGGINVSLSSLGSSPVIGGSVGMLIAATPVQVAACSFIYGSPKPKIRAEMKSPEEPTTAVPLIQQNNPTSVPNCFWSPGTREMDLKNPSPDIDLMRG